MTVENNENLDDKSKLVPPTNFKLNVLTFVNPFLGFIVGHWKLAIFASMCLIMFVQYELIGHYKNEVKNESVVISTLNDSLKTANSSIEDQNAKIKKAGDDFQAKQKEFDNLQKSINDKAIVNQKLIDSLRKKSSGTTCDDALKFMDDYIGTVKW